MDLDTGRAVVDYREGTLTDAKAIKASGHGGAAKPAPLAITSPLNSEVIFQPLRNFAPRRTYSSPEKIVTAAVIYTRGGR